MKIPKTYLRVSLLKKTLGREEYGKLIKKYIICKSGNRKSDKSGWMPNENDWAAYHKQLTFKEYNRLWMLRGDRQKHNSTRVFSRLGKMRLMNTNKGDF